MCQCGHVCARRIWCAPLTAALGRVFVLPWQQLMCAGFRRPAQPRARATGEERAARAGAATEERVAALDKAFKKDGLPYTVLQLEADYGHDLVHVSCC